nr:TonB-dependent receptor [uncultured Undibacterium sp.]
MKLTTIAHCIALIGVSNLAAGITYAQSLPVEKLQKVEITGSSIKAVQKEGALPIQVITAEQIGRSGTTSVEQLIATLSANGTTADNLSSQAGIQLGSNDRNNNGNSSANLRGLGAGSTLVLLNGRRVSLHGAKGNAVNLNSIPLAAVERVEILTDGSSAIYGTDAIGGVINFILKKNFNGVNVSARTNVTQGGGGSTKGVSIVGGMGDMESQGYNLMATVSYDKQTILNANQRSFVNGFQPERGLSPDTTGTPFATQTGGTGTAIGSSYKLPTTGAQTYNRANLLSFQGKCDSGFDMTQYQSTLWGSPQFANACAYDYTGQAVLIQPVDNLNLVTRGTLKINNDTKAYFEVVGSRSTATKQFEQSQITTSIAAKNAYPVGGPYYQDLSSYIPTFDKTKPIAYRWRCMECGGRTIQTVSEQTRILAGIDGVIGGWDYSLGASTAKSYANSVLGDGYMKRLEFDAALASGKINPWLKAGESQSAEALALIQGAKAAGTSLFGGRASLVQVDGKISGELFSLPAGMVSAAAGFDLRRESYQFKSDETATVPVRDAPFDATFAKVSRDITAIYAEMAVPVFKGFDAQLAIRRDKYSDFGSTVNPKISFRYEPIEKTLMFRGSVNSGFRAPSFFQLYSGVSISPLPGNVDDPVLCPKNPGNLQYCGIRPDQKSGGNINLNPEKSKQWSIGTVIQPLDWMAVTIDLWNIKRDGIITELDGTAVIKHPETFPNNLIRDANGEIDYIQAGYVNADGDKLRGIDLALKMNGKLGTGKWDAGVEGTYIKSFKSRIFKSDAYNELLGEWYPRDLYVRWKHNAFVTYSEGDWSTTFSQRYTAGYKDERPYGVVPAGFVADVKPYTTYNLSASYAGFKDLTINVILIDMFNRTPSFTAHNVDFAGGAGWDPRVASPLGRRLSVSANYKF